VLQALDDITSTVVKANLLYLTVDGTLRRAYSTTLKGEVAGELPRSIEGSCGRSHCNIRREAVIHEEETMEEVQHLNEGSGKRSHRDVQRDEHVHPQRIQKDTD
jgi:hypothetical protein